VTAVVPPGLPQLQAGKHLHPDDGACLMEYVSVLTGARFSDRPRCTDPTLAAIARLVNDACSDARRPQLALFAPALAGTPRGDAARTAAEVQSVLRIACTAVGATTPALRRQLRRAGRRQQTAGAGGWRAALARLCEQGPARHSLEVSVRALAALDEPQRDAVLVAMLAGALTAAGAADVPDAVAQVPPSVAV
jgi:hypothetical protein